MDKAYIHTYYILIFRERSFGLSKLAKWAGALMLSKLLKEEYTYFLFIFRRLN